MTIVWRKDYSAIEADRDIILHCSDFMGEYDIEGRFIKYKNQETQRFCSIDPITKKYETDSKAWHQREGWRYK